MASKIEFINADVRDWASSFTGQKFHAIFCDPPYELNFMSKEWDNSGVAFDPNTWRAIGAHLLPGGFGMAFSSSRTWHRLAVAIEDAGFVIHPTIWLWAYGSGFPKATNIGTQIDKAAGAEREIIGHSPGRKVTFGTNNEVYGSGKTDDESAFITAPATELAQVWDGHRYGLQALKPATEPLITFNKPLNRFCGTIVETTFIMEVLLCTLSDVPDAERSMGLLHRSLNRVVVDFVQKNADVRELLNSAIIADRNSELSLVELTLLDFAVGRVLTRDEMLQLAKNHGIGKDFSLAKDTNISALMGDTLLSIALLWKTILEDVLNPSNRFTISTETKLTTELEILRSLLFQNISASIILQNEPTGRLSLAQGVESLLRNASTKLTSPKSIFTQDNVIEKPAQADFDQEERREKVEPIIVFQKKYEGRPLDNITETGAGALNIDGSRVGGSGGGTHCDNRDENGKCLGHNNAGRSTSGETIHGPDTAPEGRWPSNLVIEHSPECRKVGIKRGDGYTINRWTDGAKPFGGGAGHEFEGEDVAETVEIWECVDGCPVRTINIQAGNSRSPSHTTNYGPHKTQPGANGTMSVGWNGDKIVQGYGDSGGPSRFFYNFQDESLDSGDPVFYCSKASRKERDAGLNEFEKTRSDYRPNEDENGYNGNSLSARLHRSIEQHNPHVSVKPLRLTEYLAKMLLPPDAYKPRRILVPFSGSGSEVIGARLAGWDEVVGIELTAEFVEISKARAKFWLPEHRAKQLRLE